jgi:hypothetical protein
MAVRGGFCLVRVSRWVLHNDGDLVTPEQEVTVGSVWRDNDRRSGNRTFVVVHITNARVWVKNLTGLAPGRTTPTSFRRFSIRGNTGYTRVLS